MIPATIYIYETKVYGATTYYSACKTSQLFTILLKQKTLTISDLKVIQQMGFKILRKESSLDIFDKLNNS
jgi:hypothetical protein